jgi:hypothetical protein
MGGWPYTEKRRIVAMGGIDYVITPSLKQNSSDRHDNVINTRRYR